MKSIVNKIKNIFFNTDLKKLETFQLDLINKIILSKSLFINWEEYVEQIFLDLNTFLPLNYFYIITKIKNDKYKAFIIWKYIPSDLLKNKIEKSLIRIQLKNKIKNKLIFEHKYINNINFKKETDILNDINYHNLIENYYLQEKIILNNNVISIGYENHRYIKTKIDILKNNKLKEILYILIKLISSIKIINKQIINLKESATRDELTNLLNRKVFNEITFSKIQERNRNKEKKFCLIFIDVDNFKLINDNYGHISGDIFLQKLADIFIKNTRKEDIITRYGGDEFIILLEQEIEKATIISQRIKEDLDKYMKKNMNNIAINVSLSIGIVEYPTHGTSLTDLIEISDELMYIGKKNGKNQIIRGNIDILKKLNNETKIKNELILESFNKSLIIPYFQKIDNNNNEIIYELFMRIKNKNKLLYPDDFIEYIEKENLIFKFDFLLLEKVLKNNYKDKLIINFSFKTITSLNFIQDLIELLAKYNFNRSNLIIKIKEEELMINYKYYEHVLLELNRLDFTFLLDHYITGFPSLIYLEKFKFSFLKIDIENLNDNTIIFLKCLISLTKELNIKLIGKYIENEKIKNKFKSFKIDYLQGYYIEKPIEQIKIKEKK